MWIGYQMVQMTHASVSKTWSSYVRGKKSLRADCSPSRKKLTASAAQDVFYIALAKPFLRRKQPPFSSRATD